MNIVILKGRLTKSPTLLFSKSGIGYTSINVAVDRYSKDKDSNADFINCTAFGKTAELIADKFTKGQEILIQGNLKVDVFEKDNKKEYKTSVLIERFEFCGSKKDKGDNETEANETDPNSDEFPF
ncbi:single-stranded DNA-binding protein [Fusobacterium pseudoperiodonticum]|uniref:single-stranded DNA-binding protein n=1 Tax=Fusobacterium pseudoperiodonticum TaxID=2663009 RepID=UPI000C1B81A4|nr:single-stranded DNA-binding protein [Fusobacterium pseudoperiodonticum]ATV64537.1 single-stranded DNA-binding protein [Fusobacterium pseudoperiodonticum]